MVCTHYDGGRVDYCMHPKEGWRILEIDPEKEIPDWCELEEVRK